MAYSESELPLMPLPAIVVTVPSIATRRMRKVFWSATMSVLLTDTSPVTLMVRMRSF